METLPEDIIIENIFSSLSIESTLQCRRVCRTWRTIIGDSIVGLLFRVKKTIPSTEDHVIQLPIKNNNNHVIQLYYGDPRHETKIEKYYSENTLTPLVHVVESNDMVGSCNGLVCYKAVDPEYPEDGLAFICSNPITGEASFIPGLKKHRLSRKRPVGGFGYVGLTNEYKVFRICDSAYVEVYTLGSPLGWRDKGLIPFDDRFLEFNESGIFANGALHWINVRWHENNPNPKMLAFGLADEEFSPIPAPPCLRNNEECRCNSKLILLGGNLCVLHMNYKWNEELYKKRIPTNNDYFIDFSDNNHQFMNKRLDIWVFKKTNNGTSCGETKEKREYYYDHTWSWTLDYSIAWEGGKDLYTPFVITKQNTVLLLQNGTSNIFCYDPKTSTLQKYSDGDERSLDVQAIPHMNSLVSLKDLGEAEMINIKTCLREKPDEADEKS